MQFQSLRPILLLVATTVYGCGGGSNGESAPKTPPLPTLNIEITPVNSIAENQSETFTFSISGAQGDPSITITSDYPGLSVSHDLEGNTGSGQLSLGQINNNGSANVTVTVTDEKSRSSSESFEVFLDNTSGLEFSLAQTTFSLREHEELLIPVNLMGAEGNVSIDVTTHAEEQLGDALTVGLESSEQATQLRVGLSEILVAGGSATLSLSATDDVSQVSNPGSGQRESDISLEISLSNSSGDTMVSDARTLGNLLPSLTNLPEIELYTRLLEVALISDPALERASFTQPSDLTITSLDEQTMTMAEDLQSEIAFYESGEGDETTLGQAINATLSQAQDLFLPTNNALDNLVTATNGMIRSIPLSLYLDVENETLSQLIGNTAIGLYEDDEWTFSEPFDFLHPIAFPDTENCERGQ